VLRVEALLQIGHPLDMRESDALGHVFLEAGGFRRVMIGEAKAPRIVDPEAPDETSISHEEGFGRVAVARPSAHFASQRPNP
jgi:hypothetical protein